MNDDDDRLYTATTQLVALYALMGKVLSGLPVPIALPTPQIGDWDVQRAARALDRVQRELLPDQPIDRDQYDLLQRMVLDWLTAYDLGGLVRGGQPGTPWRIDAMEYALDRVLVFAEGAAEDLGIDLGLDG